jgi:hypothetical protein
MKEDHARSSTEIEPAALEDPYPGLWRRCLSKKKIEAAGTSFVVELDIIVCSPPAWMTSEERNEGGWNESNLDGLIVAERLRV